MATSQWLVCILLFTLSVGVSSLWNVSVQLNPGCSQDCDSFNVVHIDAQSSSAAVHFLFSASERVAPSILAIQGFSPNAELNINWTAIADDTGIPKEAILLNDVQQSYATVFTRLVEYDDAENSADMTQNFEKSTLSKLHSFKQWQWHLLTSIGPNPYVLKDDEVFKVVFLGNSTDPVFGTSGHVNLEFMVSNSHQHNPTMPRLQFIPGLSLQFEVHLIDLQTDFPHGRFGLQLALISNATLTPLEDFIQTSSFSINDEMSPGIFEMINIQLATHTEPYSTDHVTLPTVRHLAGFFQTRPVCYTHAHQREIRNSRDAKLAKHRDPLKVSNTDPSDVLTRSLPYWFYGSRVATVSRATPQLAPVGIRIQNVSFGTPLDGYYQNSKYIVWAASFGFGQPPTERISSLLIGLLALSALVIVGTVIFGTFLVLFVRWRLHSAHGFQPLVNPTEVPA